MFLLCAVHVGCTGKKGNLWMKFEVELFFCNEKEWTLLKTIF